MLISDAPRILISRMSAVGDTILTLPVACALRQRFPQAYLGWAVEGKAAAVVRHHECLDKVIVLKRGWYTSPTAILAARRALRPLKFEIAIDCQSVTKSSLACLLSGARTRIGCRGKYGCELSPLFNNLLWEPQSTHLTDRSRELLIPLGIADPPVEWKFPIDDVSQRQAGKIIQRLRLQAGYALINPGANWKSRLWSMEAFGQVARHLGERHGLPSLVVWGSDQEHAWAQQIVAGSGGNAVLAPPTSLQELAAVIQSGRLFLSADTGPLHLAVAVGTPSIGLHGVTRPQDSGPYGAPHAAIQAHYEAGTRRQRRQTDNCAMLRITPAMVCDQCDRLLELPVRPSRHCAA